VRASQRSRFRVRSFTSRSNWAARFPTLASALVAAIVLKSVQ
jgi:hypothetical protein